APGCAPPPAERTGSPRPSAPPSAATAGDPRPLPDRAAASGGRAAETRGVREPLPGGVFRSPGGRLPRREGAVCPGRASLITGRTARTAGQTVTIWIRLPQVSSKTAVATPPI